MTLISLILFAVVWLLFFAATTRYSVQMFQERYNRWLRSTREWLSRSNLVAVLAALCSAVVCHWAVLLIFGCWMLIIAIAEFSIDYKLRLVYTMRVMRLIATRLILTLLVVAAVAIFAPRYAIVAAMLMTLDYWTIVANMLNRPLERAITRWYYRDAERILRSMPNLKIIGITGSFGKTSTKHFLYRILSERYNVLMTPGNFNTTLGVVRTIREHLKPHHEIFIVEMGAKQSGDIKEICDLVHPSIGIVTAVGEMHLETFHTVENILHTKFELIEALPADGMGVINLDSEVIAQTKVHRHSHIVSYSIEHAEADYRATNINYSAHETLFNIDVRGDVRENYATHLAGRGNILNLLAAIAVADQLGVSESIQKRAIRQIEQIEHRLSTRRTAGGIIIIDDAYNSNPTGAKMALEVLRDFERPAGARAIVVTPGFVELGERQFTLNNELGTLIAASCDMAIVVNRTNREAITKGILEGGFPEENLIIADSFAEAMSILTPQLRAGDIVLYENDLPDSFK